MRALIAACVLALIVIPLPTRAAAPPLPAAIAEMAPTLKARGGGELTFFGISVYDGWFWSAVPGWPQTGPYALDLHYHRSLDGAKIAERSVDEIANIVVFVASKEAAMTNGAAVRAEGGILDTIA